MQGGRVVGGALALCLFAAVPHGAAQASPVFHVALDDNYNATLQVTFVIGGDEAQGMRGSADSNGDKAVNATEAQSFLRMISSFLDNATPTQEERLDNAIPTSSHVTSVTAPLLAGPVASGPNITLDMALRMAFATPSGNSHRLTFGSTFFSEGSKVTIGVPTRFAIVNATGLQDGVIDAAHHQVTGNATYDEVQVDFAVDSDHDGIADSSDDCPNLANADQLDTDHDGQGDACDLDDDNDGIPDATEATLGTNPLKADTDGDGMNDSADAFPLNPAEQLDTDHDGVGDHADNCPLAPNPNQANADRDSMGDACDSDMDNDGLSNSEEARRGTNPLKADTDGDGVNDAVDIMPTLSLISTPVSFVLPIAVLVIALASVAVGTALIVRRIRRKRST
jgi:hypothetical protein